MNHLVLNQVLGTNSSNNKQNKQLKFLSENRQTKPNDSTATNHCSQPVKVVLHQHGKKDLSLLQCRSSKSICSLISEQGEIELKLASDFLLSNTQEQYTKALKHMWSHYGSIQADNCISFLKLEKDKSDIEGQLISHYLGSWLYFMGYYKSANKKYILSRIKMHFGVEKVSKAAILYQTLFRQAQGITYEGRLRIIMDTCKNGWEFFISLMIRYLKDFRIQTQNTVDNYFTKISIIQNLAHSRSSNLKVYQLDQDQNIQNLSKIS